MAENDIADLIRFDTIPISALNSSSRRNLSMALNPDMPLPGKNGFVRNWEGLAELVRIPYPTVKLLKTRDDPTSAVIELWENQGNPKIGELMSHLECLERYEVLDDVMPFLRRDALTHLSAEEESRRHYEESCPVQSGEVTGGFVMPQPTLTVLDAEMQMRHPELAFFETARYDAYVSYCDSDVTFVTKLISELEGNYKLKLFVKDRDLLPGVLEHEAEVRMLHERCERILLILSDDFLNNPRCEFQTMFAQALAVDNNLYARKVIPILYKPCELPVGLKYIAKLDYSKLDVFGSFWKRLHSSISSPMYVDTRSGRVSPSGQSPWATMGNSPCQTRQYLASSQPNMVAMQYPIPNMAAASYGATYPGHAGYGIAYNGPMGHGATYNGPMGHGATYHGPTGPASTSGGSNRNSLGGSSEALRTSLVNEAGTASHSAMASLLQMPGPSHHNSTPCLKMEVQEDEDNAHQIGNLSLTVDGKPARSRTKKDPPVNKKKRFFGFQKRNPDPAT